MAEAKQRAQEVLDGLEIQLDTVASTVEAVLAEKDLALEAAIAVDYAPDPPVLIGKLGQAADAVASSESLKKSVRQGHPGVAKPLLNRANVLRTRIGHLRSRLAVLQGR